MWRYWGVFSGNCSAATNWVNSGETAAMVLSMTAAPWMAAESHQSTSVANLLKNRYSSGENPV
jgi:hypothetical protein